MPFTAVYTNLMTSRRQPARQFFGESFKAAVARRYSPRSEDGDAHRLTSGNLSRFGVKLEHCLFRRGLAHRLVAEPGANLFGAYPPLFLNHFSLPHYPLPVLCHEPERLHRTVLPKQAA